MTVEERVYKVFTRTVDDACSWERWQSLQSLQEWTTLDSMAILEFLAGLEKEFDIRFPTDHLELELFTDRRRLLHYLIDILGVS